MNSTAPGVEGRSSVSRTWPGQQSSLAGAGVTIALHALAVYIALQFEPARSVMAQAAPIMVRLVTPVPAVSTSSEQPKAPPVQPRSQPLRTEPLAPPIAPLVASPTPAPSSLLAVPDLPSAHVEPMAPSEPAVAPPAPPAAMAPPSFNADYLNNPAPGYPTLSRRMGEEGRVVLRVHVDERGLPADVQLKTSSGFSRLDAVALETVRRWRFVPARRGETPVAAWVLVPISFSLRS